MPVPDPDTLVQLFHQQRPGATTAVMARAQSPVGSSYARLAQAVPVTATSQTVLDLACGDGYLLDLLRRRRQPHLRLIGIDRSAPELHAARRRLGPAAALCQASAQQLPLADASIDVILCHLALMLLSPLDPAVAELRRVLVPNGDFAAIIGAIHAQPDPLFARVGALLHDLIRATGGALPDLGDPRCRTESGLQALFNPATGFTDLRVQEVRLRLDGSPAEIMHFFRNTYPVFALGAAGASALEARLWATLEPQQDATGCIPFTVVVTQLECRRADETGES